MDRDELRKLLNIKPKQDTPLPLQPPSREQTSKKKGEASPWVLDLDAYDQAQGPKILRHNPDMRKLDLTGEEVSDFYALHYLTSPELTEEALDNRRREFIQKILESPDHLVLHRRTELNPISSELATEEVGKAYSKLKEEDKKRDKEREKQGEKQEGTPKSPKEKMKDEMALMKAVSTAISKSEEKIEEFEEGMSALGCGPGTEGSQHYDPTKLGQLFSRIKDNTLLRKIFDKAGRCRRYSQAQQRQKVQHSYDDMIGVILDGKVERLLPQELLQLADEDLELDAMRRLLESQSMSKHFQGTEKVGKGPIVICIDESGSMSGEPEEWAKAIALTMAWLARSQKRFCVLIGYSGGTEGNKLVLPPNKWNEAALLDWLTHFFGMGTDMDVPLEQLPKEWWGQFVKEGMTRGKTDLILITDAICRVPKKMEEDFLIWKAKEQVRCISIILNGDGYELHKVSDEIHSVSSLDLGQEAVQRVLSI